MRYFSDITKTFYDNEKECKQAETSFLKQKEEEDAKAKKMSQERAKRAHEVEDAYTAYIEAYNKYNELLKKFIKDYKTYHMTISNTNDFVNGLFDSVFKFF